MSKFLDNSEKARGNAWSGGNWIDSSSAVLGGIGGIASAFGENSQLNNSRINLIDNQIKNVRDSQFDYGDYDSLQGAIMPTIGDIDSENYRTSDKQRALSTIKGVGSGAIAGAQIGGPIGAIVGGAAGLFGSIFGMNKNNRDARRIAREQQREADLAKKTYWAGYANNADIIANNKFRAAALNLNAFGGMLKNNNIDNFTKSKVRLHAFGGDMLSTIGREDGFTNGVVKIDNGGTHETNPFDGVLMGVDPAGTPNLVEQGEVLFNDYVFSNRLYPTGGQLESVRLPKKYEGKSYSDIAWDLQKESQINPLDKISRNTLIDSMAKLTTLQEQSRERDQEYEAFDNLEQVFADGGNIHIKKSKVGTFTAAAKKRGMGVQEFASKVLANPDNYSESMRRKAQFAHNAAGWKHAFGGGIGKVFDGGGDIQNDKTQIDNTRVSLIAPSFTPMWKAPSEQALFHSGLYFDDNGVYSYGPYLDKHYISNDAAKSKVEETMRRSMGYLEDDVLNNKQIYKSKLMRSYPKSFTSKPVFAFGGNLFDNGSRITPLKPITNKSKDSANYTDNPRLAGLRYDENGNIIPYGDYTRSGFRANPWTNIVRATPVIGSFLNTVGNTLGIRNKEDFTYPNMIGDAARTIRNVRSAPIAGYMTYNPYDVDYEVNRLQNVGLGTQRSLTDIAGGNALAARNSMLALNDNITEQIGAARRAGDATNEQRRQAVQQFNTGIDQFNAQQSLNSQIYNQRADEERVNDIIRQAMLADTIQSTMSQARSAEDTAFLNNAGQWGNDMMYNDMARFYLTQIAPYNDSTKQVDWIYGRRNTGANGGKISKVKEFKK